MRAWHFSENAYPYLPPPSEYKSIRVTLPNGLYDPKKGAELYDRFLAEWQIARWGSYEMAWTAIAPAIILMLPALSVLRKRDTRSRVA